MNNITAQDKILPHRHIKFSKNRCPYSYYISVNGTKKNFEKEMEYFTSIMEKEVSFSKDSDDSDDDFSNKQKKFNPYIWKQNGIAPKARHTTITCKDGNIKGNQLITLCRNHIKNFLNIYAEKCQQEDPINFPGKYFAFHAGRFSKYKTSIDFKQEFTPGDYVFGLSQVKIELNNDDRMFITDNDLKNWLTEDLNLPITRWDIPYRGYQNKNGEQIIGIDNILMKIKSTIFSDSSGIEIPVPDNQLGTIQLYCAFPEAYPILGGPYENILRQGELHKFLDFFNALIFGLEASRNNLVFFTGIMMLQFMREGSFTSPDGSEKSGYFFYNDLLDLFPMAVTGTGSGNFIAEKIIYEATNMADENKNIMEEEAPVGFSFFRKNHDWLKVTVKSSTLIHNFLSNHGVVAEASKCSIDQISEQLKDLLDTELEFHYIY